MFVVGLLLLLCKLIKFPHKKHNSNSSFRPLFAFKTVDQPSLIGGNYGAAGMAFLYAFAAVALAYLQYSREKKGSDSESEEWYYSFSRWTLQVEVDRIFLPSHCPSYLRQLMTCPEVLAPLTPIFLETANNGRRRASATLITSTFNVHRELVEAILYAIALCS